ncbi:MAG: hypothetical protein AAGF26_13480 [Cyanobacteria bacterium P01_G01_bin.49]
MTSSDPNRLDRIEALVESNARAIEALSADSTNKIQETVSSFNLFKQIYQKLKTLNLNCWQIIAFIPFAITNFFIFLCLLIDGLTFLGLLGAKIARMEVSPWNVPANRIYQGLIALCLNIILFVVCYSILDGVEKIDHKS